VVSGPWLLAGTEDGAVRTQDGSTWVSAGLGGERVASLSVAGGTLLAGTGHDAPADGIVQRSDDSGASWRPATSTPVLLGLPGETVQAVLAPSGATPALAGTAGGGALRSGDGRGGWSATSGMSTGWVTAFWRDPASGAVLAGSDDGLYAWGGSTWTAVAFPQANPWVQALATASSGRPLAGTYDGAVYERSPAGGWTPLATGLPSVLSVLAVSGGGVLVGTSDGLACAGCPASIAATSAGPGGGGAGSRPARTLPPPGARAGTTASAQAAGTPGADATPSAGASTLGTGSPSKDGGLPKLWLAVGLGGLSLLLFVAGVLRDRARHRPPSP